MPRVKRGVPGRARHKKVIKLAKGYFGAKSKLFRVANQAVMKSLANAYRDRRNVKRDYRKLWIARINAAARINGMSYSRMINGLKRAGVDINRKMLADLAVNDSESFSQLVGVARDNL
jgi:large subunit ribosomal protein L20